MKINKNDLVKLVLYLTPRERQEFKELHSGNFDYIELFNHITKNKGLDEKAFAAQLNKQKGSDGEKTINVSVIKSYLLEKLLNSLRSSYKSPVASVYQNLSYSDILISKGAYSVAGNYLVETEKNCTENNLIQEKLIYLRQLEHVLFLNNTVTTQEETKNRFTQYNSLLDTLAVESDLLHFTTIVQSFIFYNIAPDTETFFALLMKINAIDLTKGYPFFLEQHIIMAKSAFEVFQFPDADSMSRIRNLYADGINEWKKREYLMEYNGYWFLNLAFGYFAITGVLGATNKQVDDFIELLDIFKGKTKSETEKNRAIELRYCCELIQINNGSDKNKYSEVLRFKDKFKALSDNGFTRTAQVVVWEQYTYINAYIQLKQYDKVIDCCNHLLYDKAYNVKNFMIFYASVHFANLQAHYELGNLKFLTYEIAKSKAILEKTIAFGEFEDEFFKLLKLLMGTNTDKEKTMNALKVHKANFEAILQEGFFKAHFGLYDVVGWIDRMMN